MNNETNLKTTTMTHPIARKTPYVFTPVTVEDLKDYRIQIIAEITKYTNDVKEVMSEMVKNISSTKIDCEIEYTNSILLKMGYFDGASNRMAEINRENAMKNLPSSMR